MTEEKLQVHGTRRADGVIVNESPTGAPVPKVVGSTYGGSIGAVLGALVMFYLQKVRVIATPEEADLWNALLQLLIPLVVGGLGALVGGYITPPAGFGAPDEVKAPGPPPATRLAILLSIFIPLWGCDTLQGTAVSAVGSMDPETRIVMTCRGYEATLRSLAGYRAAGKLGEGGVQTVERLRTVANPICTSEKPPTGLALRQAIDAIEGELNRALLLEQQVRPPGGKVLP